MSREIKIEIKSRWRDSVIFEYSSVDNTLAKTITEALSAGADLRGADLRGADLREADLRGADLCDANLRGADLCDANLRGANLCDADLCEANLCGANLRDANLRDANLRGADLCDANLYRANLRYANLYRANLRGANLCYANLCYANLYRANLRGANLRDANLCDANLCDANLNGADMDGIKGIYTGCPTDGSFIGWKRASGYIVKLQIPEDARRSSAGSEKCRCDKAFVIEIQNIDGTPANVETVCSDHDENFVYTVGAAVEAPDFDDNRWNECASGIHFFIDRRAAVEY